MGTYGDGATSLRAEYVGSAAALRLTIGNGALGSEDFTELLASAGARSVVDVRGAPSSRRHPRFSRKQMKRWLPVAGIDYLWEKDPDGHRRSAAGSVNTALRHPGFRGYADHMTNGSSFAGLARPLDHTAARPTAATCRADSLVTLPPPPRGRRCRPARGHRRLLPQPRRSAVRAPGDRGSRIVDRDETIKLVDDDAPACYGLT